MKDEYNIGELNPRKNPYESHLGRQVSISLDGDILDYFEAMAEHKGIPYQMLISLYLKDCADNQKLLPDCLL